VKGDSLREARPFSRHSSAPEEGGDCENIDTIANSNASVADYGKLRVKLNRTAGRDDNRLLGCVPENQQTCGLMMPMRRVVSVFCGCGGLDYGFKRAGFDLVYACDSDPAAVDCYARNVDPNVHVRDVRSETFHGDIEEVGQCDVVLGGFPCQGFSKAGPKQENDSRNMLYVEMLRIVSKLRPRVFLAENVDGLSQNYRGAYLKRIISDFREIGYEVDHLLLDAVSFGAPQHRRRIIFAGTRRDMPAFKWPEPTHDCKPRNGEIKIASGPSLFDTDENRPRKVGLGRPVTIRDAIADLLELHEEVPDHAITKAWPSKYHHVFRRVDEGQKLCNVRHASTSVYTWQIPEVFGSVTEQEVAVLETISRNRRHRRYGDIPNGNPLPVSVIEALSGLSSVRAEVSSLLAKGYLKEIEGKYDLKGALFCSGLFKRPRWDEPSPTVLTNFHNPRYFLHPKLNRPFSLRECARLQSFPDDFRFTSQKVTLIDGYRLVGNAVPPCLSSVFAEAVSRFLDAKMKATVAL
jgi:DNA (cytosine-5)-methyltransferase 1